MKKITLFAGVLAFCLTAQSQLKGTVNCPVMTVNILDGKVNEVLPTYTVGVIKEKLPCYTAAEEESADANCGGGVFYKDKDIYFFTSRDYVEIGPKFKGKLSLPLIGANRNNLFKWLGHPNVKDAKWDAFTTSYGILILYYDNANKVNKIRFSTQSAATIKLCE